MVCKIAALWLGLWLFLLASEIGAVPIRDTIRIDWTGRIDHRYLDYPGLALGQEVGGSYTWDYRKGGFRIQNDLMSGGCKKTTLTVERGYSCKKSPNEVYSIPPYSEDPDNLGIFVFDGDTYWGLSDGVFRAGNAIGTRYSEFSYTSNTPGAGGVWGPLTSLHISRTAVPEPSGALVFGLALVALALRRKGSACVALCLTLLAPAADATWYSIVGGGAQFQIGHGHPIPLQQIPTTMQLGTGTDFPPLLIPAKAKLVEAVGTQLEIPAGAFRKPSKSIVLGAHVGNLQVFEIETNFAITNEAGTLRVGGRPGPNTTTLPGIPAASNIRFVKTKNQFGGAVPFKIAGDATVWVAVGEWPPCRHFIFGGASKACSAGIIGYHPHAIAQGRGTGAIVTTPGGPNPTGIYAVSAPNNAGTIVQRVWQQPGSASNMVSSAGFAWTTGMITISAPSAYGGVSNFRITGRDDRVNGVGSISLVSGALSTRALGGPTANRGWMVVNLPEPSCMLVVGIALAILVAVRKRVSL